MSSKKVTQNTATKIESPYKSKQNIKNTKSQKKLSKLSSEQLNQLQCQKIKEFFNSKLSQRSIHLNISPVTQHIQKTIVRGQLKVPQKSESIQKLLKPIQQPQPKITAQQMKIYEKQAKRIEHMKLIACLNKQLKNKEPQQSIPYILTKQDHQRKVRQIIEQKKQRQKKIQQLKKILKEKQISKQKQQKQKQIKLKLQQKQKRRIMIQDKITKQKQDHIHFLSEQIKHRSDFQDIINKKPLHVKMEQHFVKTIQMPQLQQKKRSYKNLRQFKQKYAVETIKQHQKQYLERYNWRMEQSKLNRSAISSLDNLSYKIKMPQKSQRLKGLLAEEILKNKMRWTQKDLYQQEKLKRQENYLKKLKQQYQPKIDIEKQKQLQSRILKQKAHLAKIGLEIDRRKVGLSYLSEVKRQASKIKDMEYEKYVRQSLQQQKQGNQTLRKYNSQSLPKMKRSMSQSSTLTLNKNNQFLQKIRQKKLSKILNSEQQPQAKLQKLKLQTQKLNNAKQMKYGYLKHNFDEQASREASNLALNSIKAKINQIQLMKKR